MNGILEYEGEYLYDKIWNGIGYDENHNIIFKIIKGNGLIKEYYYHGIYESKENYSTRSLKFEGEYLNCKRNGNGKEYFVNGALEFEGEYLNDKRNGNGKEYHDNGRLKYEGEYLNAKKKWKWKRI